MFLKKHTFNNFTVRCQDMHSEGDSPNQYYTGGPSQKGRPRKRKLPQGSPEDLQVQTMRMASTALGKPIAILFTLVDRKPHCEFHFSRRIWLNWCKAVNVIKNVSLLIIFLVRLGKRL